MTPAQKLIVLAYRYLAILVLLAVLATAGGYAALVGFYTLNTSWAAPVIISQTNERILQLTSQVLQAQQTFTTLNAEAVALTQESEAILTQEQQLTALHRRTSAAVTQQQHLDTATWRRLAPLKDMKRVDGQRALQVAEDIRIAEASVAADLAAGLITQQDAARARASFSALRSASTDELVSAVTLDRQVQELENSASTLSGGQLNSPKAIDLLASEVALNAQVVNLRLKRSQNAAAIANRQAQARQLGKVLDTLMASPYYRVSISAQAISYAFIPYENEAAALPGAPVYDCVAQVLFCRQVGSVKRVHRDEEIVKHPLFKLEMRGVLAELELTVPESAKSRVVFFGRAPLFI